MVQPNGEEAALWNGDVSSPNWLATRDAAFDRYLDFIATNGYWGGGLEARALADFYRVRVKLYWQDHKRTRRVKRNGAVT